jgi:hypothetical protein
MTSHEPYRGPVKDFLLLTEKFSGKNDFQNSSVDAP